MRATRLQPSVLTHNACHRALASATAALTFLLLLLPSASALTTTSFTSTADFDGGAYSDAAGQRGATSFTCNAGVTANQIELDSLEGNEYCIADADGDTSLWNLVNNGNCETLPISVAGGVLNEDVETLAGGCVAGVISAVTLSGDFDIEIQVNRVTMTNINDMVRVSLLNEVQSFCGDGATEDGVFYDFRRDGAANLRALAATCTNGVQAFIGAESAGLTDPQWMRITRVSATNTITWFFGTDGIAWTQDETTVFATTGTLFLIIALVDIGDDATPTAVDFDNYILNAGAVSAGGYVTTGTWTTTTIAIPVGEMLNRVAWTDANEAAGVCVDQVEILVLGVVVETFAGCPTSPVVPTVTIVGSATVRFTLISAGASTPNLQDVEVRSDVAPPGGTGDDDLIRLPFGRTWLESLVITVFVFGSAAVILAAGWGSFVTKRTRR